IPRSLQAPGAEDPERVKKLAALGYLSATSPDLARKDLPDPKDRVAAVEKLKTGDGHLQAGPYAEARGGLPQAPDPGPRGAGGPGEAGRLGDAGAGGVEARQRERGARGAQAIGPALSGPADPDGALRVLSRDRAVRPGPQTRDPGRRQRSLRRARGPRADRGRR